MGAFGDAAKKLTDSGLAEVLVEEAKAGKPLLGICLGMQLLFETIKLLATTGTLPAKYHPHKLVNQRVETWECHIQPDWLMTWEQNDMELTLLFLQTGTHSDLF